jgi:hypothetical protein
MLEANVGEKFPKPPPRAQHVGVHAYGLLQPSHMEWTQDGRLLVSEFGRGRVVDVTDGGDCRDATPFAEDLTHPAGLLTDYEGSRILVADTGRGEVLDITEGGRPGDFAALSAGTIAGTYGLTVYRGQLLTTFSDGRQNGIARVGELPSAAEHVYFGGFPNGNPDHPPYISLGACPSNWNTVAFDDRLLYVHSSLGAIYDISEPGSFSIDTPKFVEGLKRPLGMIFDEATGLLYVTDRGSGSVKPVPREGDVNMRFVVPVASGFGQPSCVRLHPSKPVMYVCDMAECVIWSVELLL